MSFFAALTLVIPFTKLMLSRAYSRLASGYQHKWLDGTLVSPVMRNASKILCVARNYTDSAEEKSEPLVKRMENAAIFLKPPSSLVPISPSINLNGYTDVVCETEMAILLGSELVRKGARGCSLEEAKNSIAGITVAFDFTRKDLQNKLKGVGKPWELSKAFDGACPIGQFVPTKNRSWNRELVQLVLNDNLVLSQDTNDMILSPFELIQLLTQHFTLSPGDVILTGTPTLPQQPPRLQGGDRLVARVGTHVEIRATVGNH